MRAMAESENEIESIMMRMPTTVVRLAMDSVRLLESELAITSMSLLIRESVSPYWFLSK